MKRCIRIVIYAGTRHSLYSDWHAGLSSYRWGSNPAKEDFVATFLLQLRSPYIAGSAEMSSRIPRLPYIVGGKAMDWPPALPNGTDGVDIYRG